MFQLNGGNVCGLVVSPFPSHPHGMWFDSWIVRFIDLIVQYEGCFVCEDASSAQEGWYEPSQGRETLKQMLERARKVVEWIYKMAASRDVDTLFVVTHVIIGLDSRFVLHLFSLFFSKTSDA